MRLQLLQLQFDLEKAPNDQDTTMHCLSVRETGARCLLSVLLQRDGQRTPASSWFLLGHTNSRQTTPQGKVSTFRALFRLSEQLPGWKSRHSFQRALSSLELCF